MTCYEQQGIVGGIQRSSVDDGPGIRTTVFLKGCPLNCVWCHNPELISFEQELMYTKSRCIGCRTCIKSCSQSAITAEMGELVINRSKCNGCMSCTDICPGHALRPVQEKKTVKEIMEVVLRDSLYYEESGGGITISGGELLCQGAFTEGLMDACHRENITVALDTSGFGSTGLIISLARKCDYILYDIKSGIDSVHRKFTGVSNQLIRKNLECLCQDKDTANKIIIRMPLIHGINDTEEDIAATCTFLKGKGLKRATLHPYHELGISKAKGIGKKANKYEAPSDARIEEIRIQLENTGIHTTKSDEML